MVNLWGPWVEDKQPEIGDYIQLKMAKSIELIDEIKILEGFSVPPTSVDKITTLPIRIVPNPPDEIKNWLWIEWRKRVIPIAKEKEKALENDRLE